MGLLCSCIGLDLKTTIPGAVVSQSWGLLMSCEVAQHIRAGIFCRVIAISVALGLLLSVSSSLAQDILPVIESQHHTVILGISKLPRPAWMAVIENGQGARFLLGSDDPVFRGGNSRPAATIRILGPDTISLTRAEGGRAVRLTGGQPLPGVPDLVFRETALVTTLEYRHRIVDRGGERTLNRDFYLVEVRGTRAILQRDVKPPPSPTELMQERLAKIPIVETAPRVWELRSQDVQVAMNSGEALIAHALRNSQLDLSGQGGLGLDVKTPLADVRLSGRGLLVTSPNLARRAGLEVGDRILQVDDVPIDGMGALYQAYRRIKSNPLVTTIQVIIERGQQPLTLTYRVR